MFLAAIICNGVVAICGLLCGGVILSDIPQLPASNTHQDPSQTAGKLIRIRFLIGLGLSNLTLGTTKFLLAFWGLFDWSSSFAYTTNRSVYLSLEFLPFVAFMSMYCLLAIYLLDLSLSVTGEINTSSLLTYWNLSALAIVLIFLALVCKTTLNFLLYWFLFVSYVVLTIIIAWTGRVIISKLPPRSPVARPTIPSSSSNTSLPSQVYRHLSTVYYLCLASLVTTSVYLLLSAAKVLNHGPFRETLAVTLVDFALQLTTQVGWSLAILALISKPIDSRAITSSLSASSSSVLMWLHPGSNPSTAYRPLRPSTGSESGLQASSAASTHYSTFAPQSGAAV